MVEPLTRSLLFALRGGAIVAESRFLRASPRETLARSPQPLLRTVSTTSAQNQKARDLNQEITSPLIYFEMVDRVGGCAHHCHLSDFIAVRPCPKLIENAELARKYRKSCVSAQQLADEYGVSKQMVLGRLRAAGVHGGKGRGRSDDNFRFPNPSYGKRVVAGRLELNPVEMKVVRFVVELRDRQGWSYHKITDELNRRGHRTRKGTRWHHPIVSQIHKNWTGKV